jgi:hypothetical protein
LLACLLAGWLAGLLSSLPKIIRSPSPGVLFSQQQQRQQQQQQQRRRESVRACVGACVRATQKATQRLGWPWCANHLHRNAPATLRDQDDKSVSEPSCGGRGGGRPSSVVSSHSRFLIRRLPFVPSDRRTLVTCWCAPASSWSRAIELVLGRLATLILSTGTGFGRLSASGNEKRGTCVKRQKIEILCIQSSPSQTRRGLRSGWRARRRLLETCRH